MNEQFPPRHVCIAGSLVLAFGVYSLVGSIASFVYDNPLINLNFLAVFLGSGLLSGSPKVRKWMLFFSVLFFLLHAESVFRLFLGNPETDLIALAPVESMEKALNTALVFAGSIYVFMALVNNANRSWFHINNRTAFGLKSLKWSVIVLTALFSAGWFTYQWTVRRHAPIRTEISLFDASSGEGIKQIKLGDRGIWVALDKKSPPVEYLYRLENEQLKMEFWGLSKKPVAMYLDFEGYQTA
ncbi:MAG: hypothetical protein KJT03_08655, partial [Verrucomicrobiae bacterium]|nr:hypothetical protein [Verrucomicrobiae bacterium]